MDLERLNVKAKRYMGLSVILMVGFFLYFLAVEIQMFLGRDFDSPAMMFSFCSSIVLTIIIVLSNVNAIWMFYLLRKGETPFQMAVVKRLRVISGLLIAVEPLQFVFERIMNAISTPQVTYNEAGEEILYSMSTFTSYGGVFLILGGVVACVALAFEYGVVLQTQADETL